MESAGVTDNRPIKAGVRHAWLKDGSLNELFGRSRENYIFRQGGICHIIRLFHLYGFYFDLDGTPSFNWLQVFLISLISLLGCVFSVAALISVFKSKDHLNFNDICMSTTLLLVTFRIPATYIHGGILMKTTNSFLRDLSAALDCISPVTRRQSCLRKIRRWTVITLVIAFVTILSGACFSAYGLFLFKDELPGSELFFENDSSYVLVAMQVFVGVWYLCANSFPFVCAMMTVLFCKLLMMCFDCYTPTRRVVDSDLANNSVDLFAETADGDDVSIAWHQYFHERLSILVAKANEVLSAYMLALLVEEIIIILLYSKSGSNADWIAGLFLSVKQTILFVVTTVACSDLNDKVSLATTLFLVAILLPSSTIVLHLNWMW